MQVLGIDIGSSTIKGAVLDLHNGTVTAIRREPFPDPIADLPLRRFEVDPDRIVESTRKLINQLIIEAPAAQAIFCCSQMGGAILVDDNGRPLTNYLSWRDQRTLDTVSEGESYLQRADRLLGPQLLSEIGRELKPGSTTSLLYWLREQKLLPHRAIPANLGDFVMARLSGELPRWEPTHALGLLNLAQRRFHQGALERLGIEKLNWGEPTNVSEQLGHFNCDGRRLSTFPSLGDQQAALLGAGVEVGDLSLNISTGSQVSQATSELKLGPYQTRRYFDGSFLNTMTHLPAGRSLNVLIDLLTELARAAGAPVEQPWKHVNHLVSQAAESSLSVKLSFFSGPMGDVGSIDGITVDNLSVGQLFQASFRNMAENYRHCADLVCPDGNWTRIVLSGGLTQSAPELRRQIQKQFPAANSFESAEQEETLMGLLKVASRTMK